MKWIFGLSSVIFLAFGTHSAQEFQSRYTRVESYQIRPGVLGTPKYAANGILCEIFIEKRHIQGDTVELGPTIPHVLTLEMIDELVPPSERGKPIMQLGGSDYIDTVQGRIEITFAAYEKVSIQIFKATSDTGDTAAIVRWKNVCGSS